MTPAFGTRSSSRVPLVVVGGGEHARVVIDAALSSGRFEVLGFVDPQPCEETVARFGLPHLGGDEAALSLSSRALLVLGVGGLGSTAARQRVLSRYAGRARFAQVIHAGATVGAGARIGDGAVLFAGVIVNTGATVGAHAVINTGAIVEHDCRLGELCWIGPAAALGGGVTVGANAYVGLGARVRDHRTVGEGAVVGMGAVVVGDVPPGVTVIGVPAAPLRPRAAGSEAGGHHG